MLYVVFVIILCVFSLQGYVNSNKYLKINYIPLYLFNRLYFCCCCFQSVPDKTRQGNHSQVTQSKICYYLYKTITGSVLFP